VKTPGELFDLSGKVAVVTGGSRGIGRSIVLGLAAAGAQVVVASRKLENCQAVAEEVEAATGQKALAVGFHAGQWADCDRLVDTVYKELGHCEILVSNAGMSPLYPDLLSVTEELYDKTHAVNAKGPFRLGVLFGTRMSAGDGGSIINVSASGSWRPQPTYVPYAMAKAGLNCLTLALAGAWSPKVRANTVLPGPFETDIAKAWPAGQLESISAANPLGRPGRADDMVGVCVFLASDAASYINGTQILVDGGAMRTL
jgi:NAD(P)-dependent dehydrogenase (short-subunit alcohol dehydrogenase family)